MKLHLLAAAAFLLAACSGPEAPAGPGPAGAAAQTAFELPGVDGGAVKLADAAGRPVLLFFFTETCPYCRQAAPFVARTAAEYGHKGLAVIGVCEDAEQEAARNFVRDFGLKFPVAYGGAEAARAYRTSGVPYLFLLDASLGVHDTWAGYGPEYDAEITAGINKLLAGK